MMQMSKCCRLVSSFLYARLLSSRSLTPMFSCLYVSFNNMVERRSLVGGHRCLQLGGARTAARKGHTLVQVMKVGAIPRLQLI